MYAIEQVIDIYLKMKELDKFFEEKSPEDSFWTEADFKESPEWDFVRTKAREILKVHGEELKQFGIELRMKTNRRRSYYLKKVGEAP